MLLYIFVLLKGTVSWECYSIFLSCLTNPTGIQISMLTYFRTWLWFWFRKFKNIPRCHWLHRVFLTWDYLRKIKINMMRKYFRMWCTRMDYCVLCNFRKKTGQTPRDTYPLSLKQYAFYRICWLKYFKSSFLFSLIHFCLLLSLVGTPKI